MTAKYCVIERDGCPGWFDGENIVTPPEDRVEIIEADNARAAKAEYCRRFDTDMHRLRAYRVMEATDDR